MTTFLVILTAFAAVGVLQLTCDAQSTSQDQADGIPFLREVIGFKPCIDENCEIGFLRRGPSLLKTAGTKITYEPQDPPAPIPGKPEDPRVHCIFLRPSALATFKELELVYPDISEIKYSVLEDLIHYMYSFATLAFGSCEPNMKLLDLVILAANSLKEQYHHEGSKDCEYSRYETDYEKPGKIDKAEIPCDSESSDCYTTMKSKVESQTPVTEKPYEPHSKETEKPYVPSSTEKPRVISTEKPYFPSSTYPSAEKPVRKPCFDTTSDQPCQSVTEEYFSSEEEIIAEHEPEIPHVGSMRGIPGIHYPNYTDIPITTFSCADKKYIPGFYADLDTGCQVFHVCYEHRRESFLCPVGTTFNQPILACDYWYSSNCSLASSCYDVNEKTSLEEEKIDVEVEEILTAIAEDEKYEETSSTNLVDDDLDKIAPLFPIKATVTYVEPEVKTSVEQAVSDVEEVAAEIVDNIATTATRVISDARVIVKSIPEPVTSKPVLKSVVPKKTLKLEDLLAASVIPVAKAKLASIPVSKVTAFKTAVPVVGLAAKKVSVPVAAAKAKLATKVAAIPAVKAALVAPVIAKTKMAAIPIAKAAIAAPILAKGKMAAIPAAKMAVAAPVIAKGKLAVPAIKMGAAKVAAKSSIPVLKAKMVASAVPLAKTKLVPLMKAKSAGTPLLKAKMFALPLAKSKLAGPIPLAKAKLAKTVAISPLTKKALALGYMKLLKAKKLALMG